MRPPSGTGPPGIQIQVRREFEGNRLAKDSQARAYQKVLPVVGGSQTRSNMGGRFGEELAEAAESLVSHEGVAA
jgi:hypothetical protein